MARPARKTDGYRARREHIGRRWTDVGVGRWVAFWVLPAALISIPLAAVGYGVLYNAGLRPERIFSPGVVASVLAPGGLGVILFGFVVTLIKDAKAKHWAAVEIHSDANARFLQKRGGQFLRLLLRIRRDQRAEAAALRRHVDGRMDEVLAALATFDPPQHPPPLPRPLRPQPQPTPPAPSTPAAIPVAAAPSIPITIHDTRTQAAADPTSTRAPTTKPGERVITPLDPEWVPDDQDEEIGPEPAGWRPALWPKTPRTNLDRYAAGETSTFPAAEVEEIERRSGGRQIRFSTEEES